MLRRCSKILVVLAMCCSVGLHWAVLQSAAWVGMVVSNSQSASLSEAVARTFDGKHPCKICQLVQAGKRSEQKQDAQNPVLKVELFFSTSAALIFPPDAFIFPTALDSNASSSGDAPPVPPPRSLPS